MVSLIIISSGDIASVVQADALLEIGGWSRLPDVEGRKAYSNMHARMWYVEDGALWEDDLDKRWQEHTGDFVDEVVFPSRHSAASGKPSLTLHPIGVMQLNPQEAPPFGGKSGDCPPPSPRLASWWRELNRVASNIDPFELSLEVTHHGPWLETPSLFIEIGSTSETWGHRGAAKILAGIIHRGLGLDGSEGLGNWRGSGRVLVTLGGGHYAPRANMIASHEQIWLGHMLATYALPFEKPEIEGETPGGRWKDSINAAITSTKAAFPGGEIIASLEKKAFKGWQRQAIKDYMAELGIPVLRTAQILDGIADGLSR